MGNIQNPSQAPALFGNTAAPPAGVTPAGVAPAVDPNQVIVGQPTLGQDQFSATPGAPAPRDPQVLANIAVYSLQLGSSNPVDVSQAIAYLDAAGPAYRQDAIAAVKQHLSPGLDPMAAGSMLDALERWHATDAAPQIQLMISSPNPAVSGAASQAYARMWGMVGAQPNPFNPPTQPAGVPTAGAAPGAPAPAVAAPGMAPGMPAPGAAPGAPPAQPGAAPMTSTGLPPGFVQSYVKRLEDPTQAPGTLVEIAQMPMGQLTAIVQAAASDPTIWREETFEAMSQMLCNRVKEPGALDGLRAILNRPGMKYTDPYERGKTRAAVALLNFGTPQDVQSVLRFMADEKNMNNQLRKILIDQIAQKPDVLAQPAVTMLLGAMMSDEHSFDAGIAAAHALGMTKTAQARDMLGTSPILTSSWTPANQKVWVLGYLGMQPPPYSAATVAVLRDLARSKDKNVAQAAQNLLKKTGA